MFKVLTATFFLKRQWIFKAFQLFLNRNNVFPINFAVLNSHQCSMSNARRSGTHRNANIPSLNASFGKIKKINYFLFHFAIVYFTFWGFPGVLFNLCTVVFKWARVSSVEHIIITHAI